MPAYSAMSVGRQPLASFAAQGMRGLPSNFIRVVGDARRPVNFAASVPSYRATAAASFRGITVGSNLRTLLPQRGVPTASASFGPAGRGAGLQGGVSLNRPSPFVTRAAQGTLAFPVSRLFSISKPKLSFSVE
jgi:hypothetical protein